ncbi:hypothetical protein NUKP71_50350 [Klebsiella quasipneumoniae]|nr:hypothetical protein NUKP71_50350 [Klebsiella quasipneumoniae]
MLAATIPGVDDVCSDNAAGAELAANQLLRSGWLNTLPSTWAVTLLLDAGLEYRRFGAGALMLAHVAAGQLHAYYEAHMNSWDALAGMQLIEETGGTCKRFSPMRGYGEVTACWPAAQASSHDWPPCWRNDAIPPPAWPD